MWKKIIIGTAVIVGTPILLVVVGFFLLTVLIGPRGFIGGFDRSMDREYNRIVIGADIESVVDRLGTPKSEDTKFLLPQRKGFEDAFARADESNAVIYYWWMNGLNWFYCLGFDDEG